MAEIAKPYEIIEVNENNLADYPQVICFINPKHACHHLKMEWLKKQFKDGLKIKLLSTLPEKKIAGFIEYVPGEYAWRAVSAKNFLFIHCIWIYPNKNKQKGWGSALVKEVIQAAKALKKDGVAVITSDGALMAKKDLFLKNDFKIVEEVDGMQLMALNFETAKLAKSAKSANSSKAEPSFMPHQDTLKNFQGWHIIYSKQCPWVARFIEEVKPVIEESKLDIKITELTSAKDAQNAPSIYSVFNLIKDGRILADRYISLTRFKNILKKGK